jgi:hypothetical protein
LNASFLCRPGLTAGNRSPSPSPAFQMFRLPGAHTKASRGGTNDTAAPRQPDSTLIGLLTASESHIATHKSKGVKGRDQRPAALVGLDPTVEPSASGQYAEYHNLNP